MTTNAGGAVATGGAVAAIDLGATSGRVMIGRVDPRGTLQLEQVARFPNGPVRLASGLHWDLTGLYAHALRGLAEAVRVEPGIASIGIDSWAVDYALFRGDRMLGEPFHYRDERNESAVERVHAKHPFAELYRRNGLQFLPFNTAYQLEAEKSDGILGLADRALLVPDALAFLLTGARVAERTNASTTGLVRVSDGTWDTELMDALGFDRSLFPDLVEPGARIGGIRASVQSEIGALRPIDVVAVGSHDTASAVVAVPMADPDTSAYISCGTWGLVGLELREPVTTDAARAANFTNEGGVDGRVRFLHNVMGLWLLSESVRQWERETGQSLDLPTLLADATEVPADSVAVFDANDPRFLAPGDLPARIAAWYREHDLPVPLNRAAFTRAIVESLAEAFAGAVRTAATLAGRTLQTIHVVGGGSLNQLLCQRTADRAGMPVLAGPVEATALGNVLVQARAQGWFAGDPSLEAMRDLVARTHAPRRYEPRT
ncbi:rhamnulokinase family protein [Microbacterium sp. ARD31]|uniref:rhamnulokinase n=1 Tax=Microbacterium sp. ARD31 TaxID=2962576 RepID=UPI002881DDC0|nr:rhamnulokinase family protein [Microbacterium sp. ARD31]MDT0181732.1 rhamnulokinase family protein [Microbacterium sp. ARD31]